MFSETKRLAKQHIQPTSPTRFQLQNGLQAPEDMGQYLQRPQADVHAYSGTGDRAMNTCGPKQANPSCNGYNHTSKQRLAKQGGCARLDVAGQSCQVELTSLRWDQPRGQGLQHNSLSVNYSLRECSFVVHHYQTETHLSERKCALDVPTQFRGRGNCGAPVYVAEQQLGSVRGALLTELHTSDRTDAKEHVIGANNSTFINDSELHTPNRQGTLSGSLGLVTQHLNGSSLAREVMYSTKDTNHYQMNCQAKVAQGDLKGPGQESKTFSSKQAQRAVRDQIKKVVVNLEEVLHGLKEIHLEMKEVVQEIDLLTADIDLGDVETDDTLQGCHESRAAASICEPESPRCRINRVVTVQRIHSEEPFFKCQSKKGHPSRRNCPPVAPPAYPIKDQVSRDAGQRLESTQGTVTSQRNESGTAAGRRSKKPPPYSYASTVHRANPQKAKDKGQKTPPYPFKRRLLSTIV